MSLPRKPARKLKLSEPIHFAGAELTSLAFYRPKFKTLRAIADAETEGDQLGVALEELTEIPLEVLDTLDAADALAALAIVDELIEKKAKRPKAGDKQGGKKAGKIAAVGS